MPRALSTASVIVALLAAGGPLAATPDGHASAVRQEGTARCFGQEPTMVGDGELEGTPGDDVIVATTVRTIVRAGAGDDLVCGSRRVDAGTGHDKIGYDEPLPGMTYIFIRGGAGDDLIRFRGTQHMDTWGTRWGVFGGPGADLMKGQDGSHIFDGGDGADVLIGGPGGDAGLAGGGGKDKVFGGPGQDTAHGGAGRDVLLGGAGHDDLAGGHDRDVADGGGDEFDVCVAEVERDCDADDWV